MVIGEDEKVQVPLLKDEFSGYRDKWGTSGGGGGRRVRAVHPAPTKPAHHRGWYFNGARHRGVLRGGAVTTEGRVGTNVSPRMRYARYNSKPMNKFISRINTSSASTRHQSALKETNHPSSPSPSSICSHPKHKVPKLILSVLHAVFRD
jgi:hypothetical protein